MGLTNGEFKTLRDLIYSYSGMSFNDNKVAFLERRIKQRIERLALKSTLDYCRYLSIYRNSEEMEDLIEFHGDPWVSDLDKRLSRPPRKTAGREFTKAAELFNKKQYKEAIAVADAALREAELSGKARAGGVANLRYVKALAYCSLENWREAFSAAFDFVRRHPKDTRAPRMCRWAVKAGLEAGC